MADKLVRDGMVAVLISPGFGAGWSTWIRSGSKEQAVFDPDHFKILLDESDEDLEVVATRKYPEDYLGGLRDLEVVPQGTSFTIEDYDGNESLRTVQSLAYTA